MDTKDVVKQDLQNRIEGIEEYLRSARACLKDGQYLQCAVRLQEAAKLGQFSELVLNILDTLAG